MPERKARQRGKRFFSADGASLVASASGTRLDRWDTMSWQRGPSIALQDVRPNGQWDTAWMAFNLDGTLLIEVSKGNMLTVHDGTTGALKFTLRGHSSPPVTACFSGDGLRAASGDTSGRAIIWDMATGEAQHTIGLAHGAIRAISLDAQGKILATGHSDNAVLLTALQGEESSRALSLSGNVGSLAFSPDGQRLLVGSDGAGAGFVREVDLDNGELIRTFEDWSQFPQFPQYSRDGKSIAVGHWAGEVDLWDTATGSWRSNHSAPITQVASLAVSRDGRYVAGGGLDTVVWKVADRHAVAERQRCFNKALAFETSSDSLFLTVRWANGYRLAGSWKFANDELAHVTEIHGSDWWLTGIIQSPDGSMIAGTDNQHRLSLLRRDTGECIDLRKHSDAIIKLVFSPDGTMLASTSKDQRVCLWNTRTGNELRTFAILDGFGTSLAFSPDGHTLHCGTNSCTIRSWDVNTGAERPEIAAHESNRHGVTGLAYNPGGTLLASCSGDGTVRIWDGVTGEKKQTIAVGPPLGLVNDVAFFPDGRHVATANHNGTVYILRVASP